MARQRSEISEIHVILERIDKTQEAEKKRIDVVYDMMDRLKSKMGYLSEDSRSSHGLIDKIGVNSLSLELEGLLI